MYIYGKQPVLELLHSQHKVVRLILAKGLALPMEHRMAKQAELKDIPIQYQKKEEMQRFCGSVVHQGIAAEIRDYQYINEMSLMKKILNQQKPLVLILDQIQDVHNVGAIIRSAEVAGVTAVILPEKGSAGINETVAKTSAGAIFHCAIHQTSDLMALLDKIAGMHLDIIAMVPNQEKTIYKVDLNKPLAILVGSEGRGVRKNLLPYCSQKLSIRQYGRLDSLNVSVATALVLFEAQRQRLFT
jgi:23S rRNA (guanosine2251-2'-O)-methyltransferase